ncbi:MAG: 7-cyano-7-deazaguanine synthase [Candidatus Micrarchaeota archaeon]
MVKAIGMFSGGLDSSVAIRVIREQGIEVIALHFESPFCACQDKGCTVKEVARELGVQLKLVPEGMDFVNVVRKPKHGYGSAINPCIDCRIRRLRQAKKIARKIGADFIFTGEVLGQRPMSQHSRAMKTIEREAGLEGKLLRPLSAKLMPETEAEKKGFVDRGKLLSISGRRRVEQAALAKKYGITKNSSPGGGCPLTEKDFAAKLRDLFCHKKRIDVQDVVILRYGRHFRIGKNKIVVGRNKRDNEMILMLKKKADYALEVPNTGSPITILQGPKTRGAIDAAASLTARYSDSEGESVLVEYWKTKGEKRKRTEIAPANDEFCKKNMLTGPGQDGKFKNMQAS